MASNLTPRSRSPSLRYNCFLFTSGAAAAFLLIWVIAAVRSSIPAVPIATPTLLSGDCNDDPHSFYLDPDLSYSIGAPMEDWDQKRTMWLHRRPWLLDDGGRENVLMITGSQPSPCKNKYGDHILLRLFKNKVDYCRLHKHTIFYNNAWLEPSMRGFWAKLPVIRAAMVAHPDAEWVWWVDADAVVTDMEFRLPLEKYKDKNFVVHGWPVEVFRKKSWTGLNAGVFLIRNCQWSMEFMEKWAEMGPKSGKSEEWGRVQKEILKDKLFPQSDDQAALILLLLRRGERWEEKIHLESEYLFEGYWLKLVGRLDKVAETDAAAEMVEAELRRRRAEGEGLECRWGARERWFREVGMVEEKEEEERRRPFITHFTGCQPCSGDHNVIYTEEACRVGMEKALNFADNQVLRSLGFQRKDLENSSWVSPLL